MGLKLFVPIKDCLNSVVAINTPEDTDSKEIPEIMSKRFNGEFSGAFSLDTLSIGQMEEQCRSQNLFKVLNALDMSSCQQGVDLEVSLGRAELERNLVIDPENLVN